MSSHLETTEIISGQKNLLTARWNDVWLHSKYDPITEAKRQYSALPIGSETKCFLLIGGGLGYLLDEILNQYEGKVLWIEYNSILSNECLKKVSISEAIRKGRLELVGQPVEEDGWRRLLLEYAVSDMAIAVHRASAQANAEYAQIFQTLLTLLDRRSVNQATLTKFEKIWLKNIVSNIPRRSQASSVSALFETISQVPVVVIGAGPSLSESLDLLRSWKSKALLISVDTALPILLHAHIDPDVIVTVDPQPINRCYLEGYEGDAILVADPATSSMTLRKFKNEIFVMDNPLALSRFFNDISVGKPGSIAFGGSVSTNAYDLAIKMGGRHIVLVGQDLSFTSGLAHCKGAILEERWNLVESRVRRREYHNYKQIYALPNRVLPSKNGQPTRSNDKMKIFYQWFLNRLRADESIGIEISTTGERGADLKLPEVSFKAWPESEVLRRWRKKLLGKGQEQRPEQLEAAISRVDSLMKALNRVLRILNPLLNLLKADDEQAGNKNTGKPSTANPQANEAVVNWESRLREEPDTIAILGSTTQREIFQTLESVGETALNTLSIELYSGLADSGTELLRQLERQRRILTRSVTP